MRLKWHNNQVCGNVALGHWAHTSVELLPYLWPRVKEGLAFLGQGDTFLEEACPLEFLIQGRSPWGTHGRSQTRKCIHYTWRGCPLAHWWGRIPTVRWVLGRGPSTGWGSSYNSASSLWGYYLLG